MAVYDGHGTPGGWFIPPGGKKEQEKKSGTGYEAFPGFEDQKNTFAHSLSGGEQQMLATARGIMARPKLLTLDEPSLGLAPILVNALFEIFVSLNTQGTTILLVEQNLHQALHIATRGYVLENGLLSMEGSGDEILSNPKLKEAYLGI